MGDEEEGDWWVAALTQVFRAVVEGAIAYLPPMSPTPGDAYSVDPRIIMELAILPNMDDLGIGAMDEQASCMVRSIEAVDDVATADIVISSVLVPTVDPTLGNIPEVRDHAQAYVLIHQGGAQVDVETGRRVHMAMTIQGEPTDGEEQGE
ncbi:MAG: hypothetical protein ACYTFO_08480, partial [Planctomycetota bacterium]